MSDELRREAVPGGWVVSRATNQPDEDGVRWIQLSFHREPEPEADGSGGWPRSSATTRVHRRSPSPSGSGTAPRR